MIKIYPKDANDYNITIVGDYAKDLSKILGFISYS